MRYILCLLSLIVLWGCGLGSSPDAQLDVIYTNGVIWTGVDGQKDAAAMGLKNGSITIIGDNIPSELKAKETIDLGGRFVMAGFMDNHVHFMEGGAALASVQLRDANTKAEFVSRIADYTAGQPKGRWVLNGNWDHELWGGELPHKDWIDEVTPNNPVYLIRLDGHMALANSAALAAAGITKDTPDPEGGIIGRDQAGELTGILKDNALNIMLAKIPPPAADEIIEQFVRAQDHALSLGLTKVHAVIGYPTETTMLDIFQMARTKDVMKIRAKVSTPLQTWETARDAAISGTGNELLSWGSVKGFIDGSLGSTTAWFHDPYSHDPSQSGFPLDPPDTLKALMSAAGAADLGLSIHAIGDKAIDTAIDNMVAIAGDDLRARRYTIEHFQHPTTAAIKRAADHGIIISAHPYHAIDDGRWAEERIGAKRTETTYAFKSILENGSVMTFGSDWPVAPLNPMDGVYAAVTRETLDGGHPGGWVPKEKISVEQALKAYTSANAYAFGEEDVSGTLEAGKRADFVILSADPRAVDPLKLRDIQTEQTVINGQIVFTRK